MPDDHQIARRYKLLSPAMLEDVARLFKALCVPTRAQLMFLLTQEEYSVNDLSAVVDISTSAVSHHLAMLRELQLVTTRRDGNHIYYSIDNPHLKELFEQALSHVEHQTEESSPQQRYEYIEPTVTAKGK